MEMQDYSFVTNKKIQRKRFEKFLGHKENISPLAGALFVFSILSLYAIVYFIQETLPTSLYVEDEERVIDRFIAERAQNDLKDLTDIGPRVVGTYENEMLTVELLKQKILKIIHKAHKNQKIEFDIQVVSGISNSFHVYENIQNIIVKVHANKYSEHSLLINTHFDSAPTSPGGGDNGINCAVALEVLRKTTQCPHTLAHNVIYLFNGAEEVGLLGAHGFITQHRWARAIKAFINLDANGSGGKLALFQLGREHWLLKYVSQISLPKAQVIGEELYESGFLPFDTDYSVFTTIGKIAGLNFALTKNAHRYHTRYDDFQNIPLSTYQHTGDALLKLVRTLANSSELTDIQKKPQINSVYYDFMGLFLIYYTKTIDVVINIVVCLLSILITVKSFYDFRVTFRTHLKYLVLTFCGLLLGWFVAAGFVTIIAICLDVLHYNMVWYNNTWIVLGLYVIPTFLIFALFISLFKRTIKTDITYNMHVQLQSHLLRLIWTTVVLIGTCFGIRSTYVILVTVFFQTIAFILIHVTCSQYTKRTWQIAFFIFTIPGTMYTMYFLILLADTLVPSCGHSNTNSELHVAYLYLLFTLLISSTYVPFVTVLRKYYVVFLIYSIIFISCLAIVFTPLAHPYSDNPDSPTLQRFTVSYDNSIIRQGLDNNIYGRSKDLQVILSDRNSEQTLRKYITEPEFVKETDMIPLNMSIKLILNSKKYITQSQTHYNFTIEGPNNMYFTIETEKNITMVNTKLYLANKEIILKSNSTNHFIRYTRGKESLPMVLVIKTKHLSNPNAPLLKFGLKAYYQYNSTMISIPYFDKYLNQFPSWTNVEALLRISDYMIF